MKNNRGLVLIVGMALALAIVPISIGTTHAQVRYAPRAGDYFNYTETMDLNNAVGPVYQGYTEHYLTLGGERMNTVFPNGTVAAHYGYTYTWRNSSGPQPSGGKSGNFSYSSSTLLYTEGTDNQTGYEQSPVWFYIDNSVQNGGTFTLLGTPMTVQSASASYSHTSSTGYVSAIFAEGKSSYYRNDVYGRFNAAYTWDVYFDPSTGYIIGYSYVEQDTSSTGDGFTWTDILSVTTTSYALTSASPPPPGPGLSFLLVGFAVLFIFVLVTIIVVVVAIRRSRKLPKHTYVQDYGPAPPTVDLTPKQQPAQQIVIKEVVKVKCQYCGALIDSTVQRCPFCGAPRT